MQIDKYGITLTRMQAADQEMVRNWRNAAHVRPYMSFREEITPAMQSTWFRELDLSKNFYFIIGKQKEAIGVVNFKELDAVLQTAEAGIFIGNERYLNSMVPVLATVTLMEFAFEELKLKTLKAKINSSNLKAINFNESIGYKKTQEQEDNGFQYYTVTYPGFLAATEKIRSLLNKL